MLKKLLVPSVMIVCLLFSGCSLTGIEERGIIQGVVIDSTANNGDYIFSLLKADESADGGMFKVTGKNINEALSALEKSSGKSAFWGQCQYIVLNKQSMKSASQTLDFFVKNSAISPDVTLAFADKSAMKLLKEKEQSPDFVTACGEKIKEENSNACTNLMKFISACIDEYNEVSVCLFTAEDGFLKCTNEALQ